jgi:hypothetical protein
VTGSQVLLTVGLTERKEPGQAPIANAAPVLEWHIRTPVAPTVVTAPSVLDSTEQETGEKKAAPPL